MTLKGKLSGDMVKARKARGWTQMEAAEMLDVSTREYQNIESGRCEPGTKRFLRIVYMYDLEITEYIRELDIEIPKEEGE